MTTFTDRFACELATDDYYVTVMEQLEAVAALLAKPSPLATIDDLRALETRLRLAFVAEHPNVYYQKLPRGVHLSRKNELAFRKWAVVTGIELW